MDVKYRKLLEELVDSGLLNAWEQNAFQDILNRDDQYNIKLSLRQEAIIKKAKAKYFDGEEVSKGSSLPDEYENCILKTDSDGYYIEVLGKRVNQYITRKDGLMILAWLTEAIPQMNINEDQSEQETKEKVEELSTTIEEDEFPPIEEEDDPLPFLDKPEIITKEESEEDPF